MWGLGTKFRLGGTYRGLYRVFGGDSFRDILQISSGAQVGAGDVGDRA